MPIAVFISDPLGSEKIDSIEEFVNPTCLVSDNRQQLKQAIVPQDHTD